MEANKNYRIDLEFIQHADDLPKMQAKLNQWITKGELIKYEIIAMPYGNSTPGVLFNICRKKVIATAATPRVEGDDTFG